jgi:hypothetical protein
VAERLNLVPANTPTNAAYALLPDFLTMRGTVGEPKSEINKLALAGTMVKGIGSLIPGTVGGGKTSNMLQGIGGLLGGNTSSGANAAGTNAPAAKGLGGLLQGIGGALGGGTNAPAGTNAPPATNQSPVNSLLKGLFK